MREDDERLDKLERRLGFAFADRARALSALTHRSFLHEHRDGAGATDNERLEFLGDAVLDLAVGMRLMSLYPTANEGALSHMRSEIVDERGLSQVARWLGVGELLRLGRGEVLSGGSDKPSLLADAIEAVFGTVFLEAGIEEVLRLVERHFAPLFARVRPGEVGGDYKTRLQELTQGRSKVTPSYRVVSAEGPDHAKTFRVEVEVAGVVLGRGEGASKKAAEQAAARQAHDALMAEQGR
ncbi:MAG: ribonuclease III [Myxococcaceae bacterium]|nr:ribonuclease III [Myxococcaceae bacterium]